MSRSPSPTSAEPTNRRIRRWSNPRSLLAVPDADGWFHPRLDKIAARSRCRGRLRGSSRRGRDRGASSASTRGRDPSHPLSIGELTGSVGDATPAGGEPSGVSAGGRPGGYVRDEYPASLTPTIYDTNKDLEHMIVSVAKGADGEAAESLGHVTCSLTNGPEYHVSKDEHHLTPIMSNEEFQRRFVVTEAEKISWARIQAEADREFDAKFAAMKANKL